MILAEYPVLPDQLDEMINRVFALLMRAYLTKQVKHFLTNVPKRHGLQIIRLLQKLFAPMTLMDREKAVNDLNSLTMYKGEMVSSFMSRFHAKVEAVNAINLPRITALSEYQLLLLFLQKLENDVKILIKEHLSWDSKNSCRSVQIQLIHL